MENKDWRGDVEFVKQNGIKYAEVLQNLLRDYANGYVYHGDPKRFNGTTGEDIIEIVQQEIDKARREERVRIGIDCDGEPLYSGDYVVQNGYKEDEHYVYQIRWYYDIGEDVGAYTLYYPDDDCCVNKGWNDWKSIDFSKYRKYLSEKEEK